MIVISDGGLSDGLWEAGDDVRRFEQMMGMERMGQVAISIN